VTYDAGSAYVGPYYGPACEPGFGWGSGYAGKWGHILGGIEFTTILRSLRISSSQANTTLTGRRFSTPGLVSCQKRGPRDNLLSNPKQISQPRVDGRTSAPSTRLGGGRKSKRQAATPLTIPMLYCEPINASTAF
jgi:hypothetical protein